MNDAKQNGPFYTFFVDGIEYTVEEPTITGGEIMDKAGIPYSDGLLQLNEDGTQEKIEVDDVVELKPGRRLKKAPRYKRG